VIGNGEPAPPETRIIRRAFGRRDTFLRNLSHIRVDAALWGAAAAICISLFPRTAALAQGAGERANLLGRVSHSESHAALPDAVIEMPDLEVSASSDEAGRFVFRDIPAGEHVLIVHYLGYVDTTLVALTPNVLNRIEIAINLRIVPVPDLLVQVAALNAPSKLTGFYRRRDTGSGYFITRQDILERNPRWTSDMLRRVPGVQLGRSNSGTPLIRIRGSNCPISYFVDGILAPSFNIDNAAPQAVAGIEVYKGGAMVPARFRGSRSPCAVIVLWTRDPGAP